MGTTRADLSTLRRVLRPPAFDAHVGNGVRREFVLSWYGYVGMRRREVADYQLVHFRYLHFTSSPERTSDETFGNAAAAQCRVAPALFQNPSCIAVGSVICSVSVIR